MFLLKLQLQSLLLLSSIFFLMQATSFKVFNRNTKKCLTFSRSGGLSLENCSYVSQYLEWTDSHELQKAYSYAKCIQASTNSALTVGDCLTNNTVQWICEGTLLRSKRGHRYLSWNFDKKMLQLTRTLNKKEGQWLVYESDNNICEFLPQTSSSPTIPFTQPTALPRARNSAQHWPRGVYSLPKASRGCPGSTNFTWKEGWVFQDLDDTGEIKTKSSPSFNMAANIDTYGNIKRWFCTRNIDKKQDQDNTRPPWPKGTYCIYSGGSTNGQCPETENGFRFSVGYASWYNQYVLSNCKTKGVVPYGSYTGKTTRIYFCCQSNEDPNNAVSLPTDEPFYLLAFGSSVCQKINWATVIPEFIVYDTSDVIDANYYWKVYPFNFDQTDPKIYYCYYQGCNHTINLLVHNEGEINFPGESSFMDITSQSCSWKIQMPSEYVISLQFTHLNIPSSETRNCSSHYVEVFKSDDHRSLGRWCGTNRPFALNYLYDSILIVLKLGKNVTNTTGFRLSYKAMSTKEETTTAKASTESQSIEPEPASKRNNKSFPTASVVVPVVLIVFIGVVLAAFIIIRKRRKDGANNLATLPNNVFAEENPVYRGKSKTSDDAGKNINASIYESIDNESIPHSTTTHNSPPVDNQSNNNLKCDSIELEDVNPLYESSEQAEYSSTVNSLYASNDC